jgi:hypothetical protein
LHPSYTHYHIWGKVLRGHYIFPAEVMIPRGEMGSGGERKEGSKPRGGLRRYTPYSVRHFLLETVTTWSCFHKKQTESSVRTHSCSNPPRKRMTRNLNPCVGTHIRRYVRRHGSRCDCISAFWCAKYYINTYRAGEYVSRYLYTLPRASPP